jgi:membrane fusion protein, multidrug efflux system
MKSFVPKTRLAHGYVVESGLKPGEHIVCEGVQALRDGMIIAPEIISLDSLNLLSADVRQSTVKVAAN